jgi:5-methylthioadenosine/S-adenosylhomocysteine deaminase
MARAFTVIRNGHLVDLRQRRTAAADILIEGDTIREIGSPGIDAPDDATLAEASDRAMMPGLVNGLVHGRRPSNNRPNSKQRQAAGAP